MGTREAATPSPCCPRHPCMGFRHISTSVPRAAPHPHPGATGHCCSLVATALMSRATSPALARARPTAHPCAHHGRLRVLRLRATTLLQIPIPVPTAAWETWLVQQKHPPTNTLPGKAHIVPSDTAKPKATAALLAPPQPAANSTWDLAAITGGRGLNPGQRRLTPSVISQNMGRLGEKDQHQFTGPDVPTGSCPAPLAAAGALEKPQIAPLARTGGPKCKNLLGDPKTPPPLPPPPVPLF